jgi:hypothetical protein
MHGASALRMNPVETGLTLGISSRILESGLNRHSYISADGNFDFAGGLKRTLSTSVDPTSLAFDAVTFGAASRVQSALNRSGAMHSIRSPLYATMLTGSTMGFSGGAFAELQNQRAQGKDLDLGAILREGAISSAVEGVAAVPGGAMRMRSAVPFIMERGKLQVDRDTSNLQPELESHQLMTGKVSVPFGGKVNVVIHGLGEHDIAPIMRYPQNRMMQFMNQRMNFDNGFPEVSTRDVTTNGVTQKVWIQRMAGDDLNNALPAIAKAKYGSGEEADVVRLVNETPQLKSQLGTAFYERLFYGDLDSWAAQYMMPGAKAAAQQAQSGRIAPENLRVQNIDADFSFLPHEVPSWSMKSTWALMDPLHRQFAGQPVPQPLLAKTDSFINRYDSPSGRAELRSLGMSDPEISGLMSRGNWFLQNKTYPPARSLFDYVDENTAATMYASARTNGKLNQQIVDDLITQNRKLSEAD